MSETTTEATAPATETQPATPAPPAQETDWKAEARKWEQRAKENSKAADKLTQLEEASKTEAQKQAERLAQAEAKVKEYETRAQVEAWRNEVAEATGVPANVLAGSTKEEIEAHAESLKKLIAPAQEAPGYRPISGEGRAPALALNGDGIEAALKSALGIK